MGLSLALGLSGYNSLPRESSIPFPYVIVFMVFICGGSLRRVCVIFPPCRQYFIENPLGIWPSLRPPSSSSSSLSSHPISIGVAACCWPVGISSRSKSVVVVCGIGVVENMGQLRLPSGGAVPSAFVVGSVVHTDGRSGDASRVGSSNDITHAHMVATAKIRRQSICLHTAPMPESLPRWCCWCRPPLCLGPWRTPLGIPPVRWHNGSPANRLHRDRLRCRCPSPL